MTDNKTFGVSNNTWAQTGVYAQAGASALSAVGGIYSALQQSKTQSILDQARKSAQKHSAWMGSANAALRDIDNDRALSAMGIRQANLQGQLAVAEQVNNVRVEGVREANDWFFKQDVDANVSNNRAGVGNILAGAKTGKAASDIPSVRDHTTLFGAVINATKSLETLQRAYRATRNTTETPDDSPFKW